MVISRDLNFAGLMLASPNQASRIYNPDGPHPVRQKHAFVVRFMRADPAWREGLSFVVKAIDRPSVQPVVEEINQYNRKRLVHTSVKYNPVNCTFYDTADGSAMNMWIEYASYYFGDYRLDSSAYTDDILNSQINAGPFRDNAGASIQPPNVAFPNGINSQFFFDKVIVYQVWGNEYTSYELINPRINSFTPDDLTYEDSSASTIQVTLQYEAIHHGNRGKPQDLFTEASLEAMFTEGPFNGQTLEVQAEPKGNSFAGNNTRSDAESALSANIYTQTSVAQRIERTFTTSEGGSLARFGVFSFGDPAPDIRSTSPQIEDSITRLVTETPSVRQVNYNKTDDAVFSAVGEDALKITGLARALNVAATENGNAPMDQVNKSDGLLLSDQAVGAFNDQMDGTFLGGVKKSS